MSHRALHRFIGMPLGLRNASETFKSTMHVNLATVKWQFTLVYSREIEVFCRSPEEHTRLSMEFSAHLNNAGVTIKLNKGMFSTEILNYLELILVQRRLRIAPHTIEAIRSLQERTSITDLLFFDAFAMSFSGFIQIRATSGHTV